MRATTLYKYRSEILFSKGVGQFGPKFQVKDNTAPTILHGAKIDALSFHMVSMWAEVSFSMVFSRASL